MSYPLLNVEWKFGVTAASSEASQVGKTHLQMKTVLDAGEGQTKIVYFEMSLPQFYTFLHKLEKAKASLDF